MIYTPTEIKRYIVTGERSKQVKKIEGKKGNEYFKEIECSHWGNMYL